MTASAILSKAAPTWGVLGAAVLIAVISNGHRWLNALTRRMEFRARQAEKSALLKAKLEKSRARAAGPKDGRRSARATSRKPERESDAP